MRILNRLIPWIGTVMLFGLDRWTKVWAFKYYHAEHHITSWLSWETTLNRGVSWGIAAFDTPYAYAFVSILVALTLCAALVYLCARWLNGNSILPLLCIGTGALSNVVDRVWYGGVIDFIVLHYQNWMFPTFNIADMLICLGIGILLFEEYVL